ncbi:MAG: META domain-containing protein [Pyrinomonadaceae bacterium]|nr:META domain-containing protein [Pyrinomonadaceae bacterium]
MNNQIEIIASITLNISKNNKISGSGGCNGFWGSYLMGKSNKIKFTKIISNTMLCEEITDFENTFFHGLQNAKTAKIIKGKLFIENNEKGVVLVFEKTK